MGCQVPRHLQLARHGGGGTRSAVRQRATRAAGAMPWAEGLILRCACRFHEASSQEVELHVVVECTRSMIQSNQLAVALCAAQLAIDDRQRAQARRRGRHAQRGDGEARQRKHEGSSCVGINLV